jgi:glycosyltransferase involved in cell wall biosynthesis
MSMSAAMERPIRANIIAWEGGGLGTDLDVLSDMLRRVGCEVAFKGRSQRKPRGRMHSLAATARVLGAQRLAALTKRPPFDVNLFIESVFPEYLPLARVNYLLVHPEWFREENLPHLGNIDAVLCKTPSGVEFFEDLPVAKRYVAWTSPDKRIAGFDRHGPLRCLHLSGASALKGSEAVVEVWSRHPEWPELTVVRHARRYSGEEAPPLPPLPNVRYETEYVSAERLTELQNSCAVHVAPSQAEGYGHVIGEAMSCGVVVVTTDAAPMNELVTPDRGVLVRVSHAEPIRRSMRSFVDLDDLERKLEMVFAMSPTQREALGARARAWYEAQDQRFDALMRELMTELRQPGAANSRR